MLAGRVPFDGATASDVNAAILTREPPPLSAEVPGVPTELERIVTKALCKNRDERYQTIQDFLLDLKGLKHQLESEAKPSTESGTVSAPQSPARRIRWAAAAILMAVALAGGVALIILRLHRPAVPTPLQYTQLTNFADSATSPALSPDGRMLAFIRGESTFGGPGQIYVKLLPDGEPVQLTHDDRLKRGSPKFSPDGARIAYTALDRGRIGTLGSCRYSEGSRASFLANASGTYLDRLRSRPATRVVFRTDRPGPPDGHRHLYGEPRRSSALFICRPRTGMAHRSYLSPDGK